MMFVLFNSNTTGATPGTRNVTIPERNPIFSWIRYALFLVFYVVFCEQQYDFC